MINFFSIQFIPNLLSLSRMILAGMLIPATNNIFVFCLIYTICGLSDLLDGYIARKTGAESLIGAKLDSLADLMMFAVITWILIFRLGDIILEVLPFILGIIVIRLINIGVAWFRYHSFFILHTWGNKITGIIVFLSPLILMIDRSHVGVDTMLGIAMLSAIEEFIIHLRSSEPDPNRRSLFFK